jgi:hypothetical protein
MNWLITHCIQPLDLMQTVNYLKFYLSSLLFFTKVFVLLFRNENSDILVS